MKNTIKKTILIAVITCLLTAFLTGCGSTAVTEVAQTKAPSQQEIPNGALAASEMPETPEEDVQEKLIQAGLNAVADESDQWAITKITDMEVLMQLMQVPNGVREHPDEEAFEGEPPENRTSPDGEFAERPDGEMPDMPQWDGENPPEGTFPEDGEFPNEGSGRQPGNRGGGMGSAMIVISSTETAQISPEDIVAAIQEAAETLGYSAFSMEVTDEQAAVMDTEEGYTPNRIIAISTAKQRG